MILLGDKLISEEIFDEHFICNLTACKGACCVEGDRGAPLEDSEIFDIKKNLNSILPYLPKAQQDLNLVNGFYETDEDNDKVTTCLSSGECVFSKRNPQGVLECMIEKAYTEGASDFMKPVSCHLYPIRVSKIGDYTALNYSRWDICNAACRLGKENQMPVFRFLKNAIERAFGVSFYEELEAIYKQRELAKLNG